MKTLTRLTAVALFALVSTTAVADVLCDHCEYSEPGIYLGGFWPGDRASFQRSTPTISTEANDFYVLDIYDNGKFTLAITGGLTVFIHFDGGNILCTGAGNVCAAIAVDQVYRSTSRRVSSTPIEPNRYVLQILTAEHDPGVTYSGTVTLRK